MLAQRAMRGLPIVMAMLAACGPGVGAGGGGDDAPSGDGGNDGRCADGERRCTGDDLEICRSGAFVRDQTCTDACAPQLGCVACVPGEGTCEGDSERVCKDDGSGFELRACDPVQGTTCSVATGRCEGACSSQALGRSYMGCEYFPTATANALLGAWDFGVIVTNAGSAPATVRLEGGELSSPQTFTVAPGAVAVKRLAYDPDLRFCNSVLGDWCTVPQPLGALVRGGSYRLRSNQPVTVYQFNPLDYVKGQTYSHSNDASLLLPTTALRGESTAASSPTWTTPQGVAYPGFVAITATQDDTEVAITTSAHAAPGNFQPGVQKTVSLDRGDVLELESVGPDADLTGTRVAASAPVQVIGGHFCTYLPRDRAACDHLEESMLPIDALGTRFVVAAPRAGTNQRSPVLTRVIGVEPGTHLTYDPPIPGAPTTINAARGVVELRDPGHDFVVTADKRINVVQYMQGQDVVGTGDPSMAQAVPTDQWRTRYLFHAPTNYEENFATIVAPTGAMITLDGTQVTGWSNLGGSGYQVARVPLADGVAGDHEITGTARFGISVYGYGRYTSYWYPGGLDLETIILL